MYAPSLLFSSIITTTVSYDTRIRERRPQNQVPRGRFPTIIGPPVAPQAIPRPAAARVVHAAQPAPAVAGPAEVIGQRVAALMPPAPPAPAIVARVNDQVMPMAAVQVAHPVRPAQPARADLRPAEIVAQPARGIPRPVVPPELRAALLPAALITEASRAILNAVQLPMFEPAPAPPVQEERLAKFECGCCYNDECDFV